MGLSSLSESFLLRLLLSSKPSLGLLSSLEPLFLSLGLSSFFKSSVIICDSIDNTSFFLKPHFFLVCRLLLLFDSSLECEGVCFYCLLLYTLLKRILLLCCITDQQNIHASDNQLFMNKV